MAIESEDNLALKSIASSLKSISENIDKIRQLMEFDYLDKRNSSNAYKRQFEEMMKNTRKMEDEQFANR